jgi:hypothetical protein
MFSHMMIGSIDTGAEFSFEKFPAPADFPALIQAFAERGRSPEVPAFPPARSLL